MNDQQITRILSRAQDNTNRARVCLRDGKREQARVHTQRAQRLLILAADARLVGAASRFLN